MDKVFMIRSILRMMRSLDRATVKTIYEFVLTMAA